MVTNCHPYRFVCVWPGLASSLFVTVCLLLALCKPKKGHAVSIGDSDLLLALDRSGMNLPLASHVFPDGPDKRLVQLRFAFRRDTFLI